LTFKDPLQLDNSGDALYEFPINY